MLWNEIEAKARMLNTSNTMVFREEIQKTILTAMSLKGCFNTLVFQGGTALRLLYGNPRFSEDIGLVHNYLEVSEEQSTDVPRSVLASSLQSVKRTVQDTFPFINQAEIKIQKDDPDLQRCALITRLNDVEKSLRIHIELAAIPSYHNEPRILNFPPINPAIRVENTDEILADKICALALRPYLKGRDLWDIYYLLHDLSIAIDWGLVRKKIRDYRSELSGHEEILEQGLERAHERIKKDGFSTLKYEMERFLPQQVLELYRPSFDSILEAVIGVITKHDVNSGRDLI